MLTALAVTLMTSLLQAAAACDNLRTLARPNTTVMVAELVAAAPAAGQALALPAYCRVQAVVKPVPDSQITVEVWMPAENWNGKFQAVGNGGWAGAICRCRRCARRCAPATRRRRPTPATRAGREARRSRWATRRR